MAAGDLITGDWEVEYRGRLFAGNTDIALVAIDGLASLPGLRTGDQEILRRHGLHPGDDFLEGRAFLVTFELYATSDAALASRVAELQAAFNVGDEAPFVFQLPGLAGGTKARVNARCRRRQLPIDIAWRYRIPVAVVEMFSVDPRLYANTEQSGATSLPTAGGGLTFNATANFVFGAVSTGGSIFATNSGTYDADVLFRIDGPVTNPSIENVTIGKTLSFTITLAAGEYLLVDTAARTVLLGGTASRYSALDADSTWFALAPGSNELKFRAITPTAATLTATWRSAWV